MALGCIDTPNGVTDEKQADPIPYENHYTQHQAQTLRTKADNLNHVQSVEPIDNGPTSTNKKRATPKKTYRQASPMLTRTSARKKRPTESEIEGITTPQP
ncbi:hypothetical protein Bca52824_046872 [Brassica carinata]|uniref:Uncharacterized protein n=1 Tax=Brassica carinata TaxID=52824 RepID=A0A8X7RI11_BRACI|nr:hypothetical protein Bca52824_046872 [Brassica carinata]